MSVEASGSAPQSKRRSPSYPGIDLELAVQRAQTLWEREHHYPASVETILSHWGYGAKSGGGYAAIAALKSFGLLEDQGSGAERKAWLTDLAQEYMTTDDDAKRRGLIQGFATKPPIHAELWNRYGPKLPSDQSLHLYLMRERGFTPNGANEVVSEWKRTMAFAGMTVGGVTVPPQERDKPESKDPTVTPPATIDKSSKAEKPTPPSGDFTPQPQRIDRTIQVPYSPTEWALLQASFPMTEREWDQMLAVLQAMKLGLVRPDDG